MHDPLNVRIISCIILILIIKKPTRCTISQIYFGIDLYMFRTDLLCIIRGPVLYTQQYVFFILKF